MDHKTKRPSRQPSKARRTQRTARTRKTHSAPKITRSRQTQHARTAQTKKRSSHATKKSSHNKVKIIPLGGVEEIGRNMTVVEYGNNIVVMDAGFQFPDEDTPGIDYILPNTQYLEENKSKIRALVISHGHLDHIGGIPYLMEKLGNPIVYTTRLSKAMILKRQEEFPDKPKIIVKEIVAGDRIRLSEKLGLKFFDVTHTIPDAIGTIVETPLGNIIYPGDAKVEHANNKPLNIEQYEKLGKENNLALLLESTNSEKPGYSMTEDTVRANLEEVFKEAPKRIIVGTFSSQLERIIEMVKIAQKLKKRVAIDGYSMKSNLEIAQKLGLFKPKRDTIIPMKNVHEFPEEKIMIICTGAQGEENASLMRIASHRHAHLKLHEGDTVVLSSSVIPGNEKNIQNLKDNLARQGAKIIHYQVADIHASGHAYAEELKLITKLIRPKFFIPVHGHYFMLRTNAALAEETAIPRENIAVPPHNGTIIEIDKNKIKMLEKGVPSNYVMVDGLGIGDVKEVVLRDRQMLAQDGIFVIITAIDSQKGEVKGSPDIISRGFVYLKESKELLKNTRIITKKIVKETGKMHPLNIDYIKDQIKERIGKYLFQKTKRRPMVLPVVIEI